MMFENWNILFTFFLLIVLSSKSNEDKLSDTTSETSDGKLVVDQDDINQIDSSDSAVSNGNKANKKHILMFHPWGTPSHMSQFKPLLKGLLDDGNIVTGLFMKGSNIIHDDYTEIVVKDEFSEVMGIFTKMFIKEEQMGFSDWMNMIPKWRAFVNESVNNMFENEYKLVKQSIDSRNLTVDSLVQNIILTAPLNYNGIYLAHFYKCPIILFSNQGLAMHYSKFAGNPENPSYQPEIIMQYTEPMTWTQRFWNTLVYFSAEASPPIKDLFPTFEKRANMSIKDINAVYKNVSLILQASHHVTHHAQALTPNVIDVGGINCLKAKSLPDDLETFMSKHTEGVVYVSFGSSVKPNEMSPSRKNAFIEAFRKLKYQVIWKWNEDSIPNLPSNVLLTKWTPQQDLLGHPNLKVFVTHGGLLSLQEAICHQTPLIGIALGNDQVPNIIRAEQKGYAIRLDWANFTSEAFVSAIERAINDPLLRSNMKKMHDIFLDQKESPVERAVYWIGYVMRHNGAHFLKPKSMELRWYEYHHIDVFLALLSLFSFIILVFIMSCGCCWRRICKAYKQKQKVE